MFRYRIWFWLVALAAMACGAFTFAQDEDVRRSLYINEMVEGSGLCTSQEALEFYDSLDSFEPVINSVLEIEDEQTLLDWFFSYEDWLVSDALTDQDRIYCYGVVIGSLALERNIKYGVLLYLTEGEAAFQEQAALVSPRAIAGGDLASIAAGDLPDAELEINRAYVELELCTIEQAIAYFETVDGYAYETRRAAAIKDSDSLKEWASQFEAWRLEAWSPFYDQPCGTIETVISIHETVSYSLALLRQTRFGNAYVGAIDTHLDEFLDLVEIDMSAIEAMQDE